jgi:putative transcriptional regulator
MPIIVNLDVMLARRKMKSIELAKAIGISETNLSLLKSGHVKGVRFGTLEAICQHLDCQPGDLLEYQARSGGDSRAAMDEAGTRKPPWR